MLVEFLDHAHQVIVHAVNIGVDPCAAGLVLPEPAPGILHAVILVFSQIIVPVADHAGDDLDPVTLRPRDQGIKIDVFFHGLDLLCQFQVRIIAEIAVVAFEIDHDRIDKT